MDECVFTIDFSCETMAAAFALADGSEHGASSLSLTDFASSESAASSKLTALLMAKARTAPAKIKGVAIAIAGDLDRDRSRVLNLPQAEWLCGEPLPRLVSEALGVPVVMERRAVVRLMYDMIMLGLHESSLTVGCYVDTHYENAIWHCGAPILGHNGTAGNIAHLTIHGREDNCFCGKVGCVDLYGAGIRLRQMHTMIFPDTPLEELFLRHGEHPIVQDFLAMMAYPIAMECNLLDPDFIVLGGDIPSMKGFPRAVLEEEIRRHAYSPGRDGGAVFLPSPAGEVSSMHPIAQYALMNGFAGKSAAP